ncbi:MAG: XRE family transcriptional regulator [Aurantibacter sp.]
MFILKQLRRKKNISQTELAQTIGVSLRTIQLYEKKDANIPIKNLTKIAQYFDLSIAELYSQERVNELGATYEALDSQVKRGHIIHKLGPGKYLISAPLVMTSHYGRYLNKYDDNLFIGSLPKIGFVIDQVSVGKYIAFEISNDSMDDGTIEGIPSKSVVLSKQLSTSKLAVTIRDDPKTLWIINHNDSIMCKKIIAFDKKNNIIRCRSLNNSPEYSDFEIRIDEVKEFYRVIKRQVDR